MRRLDRLKAAFDQSVESAAANPLHALPAWASEIEWRDYASLRYVVCGSGFWASVFLHYAGAIEVRAVVDDFHAGKTILGYPGISTDQFLNLVRERPETICINTGQSDAGYSHFVRLGLEHDLHMLNTLQVFRAMQIKSDIRVADWHREIVAHADAYRETERLLCDELSAETLYSALLYHLETDREYLLAVNRPAEATYFRSGFFEVGGDDEVYVDGGAFTGDSLQTFIQAAHGRFRKIHAYEPDPANFARLEEWLAAQRKHPTIDRITLHHEAVGSTAGSMVFCHNAGAGSCVPLGLDSVNEPEPESNRIEIPCVTLDQAIDEPISLLKLDVEGHEMSALRGAAGHLKRSRPNLAVCAYHLPTDLVDLPQFLAGQDRPYQIGLRHHSNVRYDTILYAF